MYCAFWYQIFLVLESWARTHSEVYHRMCNAYALVYMFQVFSDVYAVLNKNWKENHHDSLCEILADVERLCGVEISFVKGAYQFRGTLAALSSVLKSLRVVPGENRNVLPETGDDDVKRHAQQRGELLDGEGASAHLVSQPQSRNEEKIGSVSDTPPGRQIAADDDKLKIPSDEDKAAEHARTQHETETEQVAQAENLSVATSSDPVISDNSATPLHSATDAPLSVECDSNSLVKAEPHEEICRTDDSKRSDRHQDNNALPETDSSLSSPHVTENSLQMKENHEELHKSAGTNLSAVDVTNEPDITTKMSKHEQCALKASPQHYSVEASNDLVVVGDSSSVPRSAAAVYDRSTGHSGGTQQPVDLPTNLEQPGAEASDPSTALCHSVGASPDRHTSDPQCVAQKCLMWASPAIPLRATRLPINSLKITAVKNCQQKEKKEKS